MPQAAPRPCRAHRCPNTTHDGFCDDHAEQRSNWNKPNRESPAERGYGYAWRKLRAQVLKRDKYLCQRQDRCNGVMAHEVDHIRPKANGGTDDLDNLQAICTRCHRAKTAQESRA